MKNTSPKPIYSKAESINLALRSHTELQSFHLQRDTHTGLRTHPTFDLHLTLAHPKDSAKTLTVLFHDVQNLELNPNGESFHQLLHLQIADLSDDRLDRIRFSVEELERETLFLHCASLELLQP